MVRHHVPKFAPDMVIVNYVSDDLWRRMRYLFTPGTGSRTAAIRGYVQSHFLDNIDWLAWRSEALAATLGQRWGMTSQLPLDARTILAQPSTRFTSRDEALAAGRQAVASMLVQYPHAVLLHMPCYYELAGEEPPWLRGLAGDFRAAAEPLGARMLSLQPQMRALLAGKGIADRPDLAGLSLHQIVALPQERWPELYRWFFLPEDLHYTDRALHLYAGEVAQLLLGEASAAR